MIIIQLSNNPLNLILIRIKLRIPKNLPQIINQHQNHTTSRSSRTPNRPRKKRLQISLPYLRLPRPNLSIPFNRTTNNPQRRIRKPHPNPRINSLQLSLKLTILLPSYLLSNSKTNRIIQTPILLLQIQYPINHLLIIQLRIFRSNQPNNLRRHTQSQRHFNIIHRIQPLTPSPLSNLITLIYLLLQIIKILLTLNTQLRFTFNHLNTSQTHF